MLHIYYLMPTLSPPAIQYRDSFLAGAAEFLAEGRLDSTYAVHLGYNLETLAERFPQFVLDLKGLIDTKRSGTQYPDRVLWLINEGEYIGQASIRPKLCTSYLITYGGHIGYSIRPSCRRCGFGKTILALVLNAAREMELKRILVTCDSDNIGSRKIIEYNGGQFESAMSMAPRTFRAEGRKPSRHIDKLRYWIDL